MNMRTVDTKEYLDTVCALLEAGQQNLSVPVAGSSMCPFLYPEDTVFLSAVEATLKPGNIYLFQRPNGQYVLHRLLREDGDGTLWMLGDNQRTEEPVSGGDMLRAQAVSVRRKGKTCAPGSFLWWFFAVPWLRLRWLRVWVSFFSRRRQR